MELSVCRLMFRHGVMVDEITLKLSLDHPF